MSPRTEHCTVIEPAGDHATYRCLCGYESMPLPEVDARRFAKMHERAKGSDHA